MARVRFFAAMREAAGRSEDEIEAANLAGLIEKARRRYGPEFERSLRFSQVAVNGEVVREPGQAAAIGPADEVAFLPPVSGG